MSLHSRLLDLAKRVDSLAGRPLARHRPGAARALPADPRDVLVIRLWGLGNLVLLAPHLVAAAATRRVRLLTLERNVDFVRRQLPEVEVLAVPSPASPRWLPGVLGVARRLRAEAPDVVVDAEAFLRLPAWLARRCTGAPVVGLDTPGQGRRPLLDAALAFDPTRHVGDTFSELWRLARLPRGDAPGGLRAPADARPRTRRALGLDAARQLVVVHPGSGDHFPGRRWPAARFAALVGALADDGAAVVVTGDASERDLAHRVAGARARRARVHDLSAQLDGDELVTLLAAADLLVTNDTGPLHLADALGTRAVALYGPNTPHRYGPRLPGSRALFADLPCSPCLDDRLMKRSHCRDWRCMDALSTASVLATCRAVLADDDTAPRDTDHAPDWALTLHAAEGHPR